jgi:hypothetical protein
MTQTTNNKLNEIIAFSLLDVHNIATLASMCTTKNDEGLKRKEYLYKIAGSAASLAKSVLAIQKTLEQTKDIELESDEESKLEQLIKDCEEEYTKRKQENIIVVKQIPPVSDKVMRKRIKVCS